MKTILPNALIALILGFLGFWACATFRLEYVLILAIVHFVVALTVTNLLGKRVATVTRVRFSRKWQLLINLQTGYLLWALILMDIGWLPVEMLDLRPVLVTQGGWAMAIVSNIWTTIGVLMCLRNSPHGSHFEGKRSASESFSSAPSPGYTSVGTPSATMISTTSHYQDPAPPQGYDYGAQAKTTQDQAAAWDHHKKQNPQLYGPQ